MAPTEREVRDPTDEERETLKRDEAKRKAEREELMRRSGAPESTQTPTAQQKYAQQQADKAVQERKERHEAELAGKALPHETEHVTHTDLANAPEAPAPGEEGAATPVSEPLPGETPAEHRERDERYIRDARARDAQPPERNEGESDADYEQRKQAHAQRQPQPQPGGPGDVDLTRGPGDGDEDEEDEEEVDDPASPPGAMGRKFKRKAKK